MRILFDQGAPVPLRRYLPGHTIATAFEMGWAEFGKGDLLLEAEAQFNALVTTKLALSAEPCEPEARDSRSTVRERDCLAR